MKIKDYMWNYGGEPHFGKFGGRHIEYACPKLTEMYKFVNNKYNCIMLY